MRNSYKSTKTVVGVFSARAFLFLSLIILSGFISSNLIAENKLTSLEPTVEEERLDKASKAMPIVFESVSSLTDKLVPSLKASKSSDELIQNSAQAGTILWNSAKHILKKTGSFDDRPLYWSRLIIEKLLKTYNFEFELSNESRLKAAEAFERNSRGLNDINYPNTTGELKILVSGFDPFLLDRNIYQSNPSGVAAMLLDGKTIEFQGKKATIEAFMVPVRFADFDQGMIEKTLTPFYKNNSVDLIATISMGREHFDLERFPGKRRSASAPDNLNVLTGANKTNPLVPLYFGTEKFKGDEFVEFSLPIKQMKMAKGKFKIIDNRKISTISRSNFIAKSLQEIISEVSVEGSGGGYLSNEISYRSINLRNSLNSDIPTGHIHTPRMKDFDKSMLEAITSQIELMLKHSLVAL